MKKMLFLRPVTPVYFGRPGAMSAGEDHVGVSWFPPPVSAFQGMIRTRLLDEAGIFSPVEKVTGLVGPPDSLPEGWQLQGPFPARPVNNNREMQIWLPGPAFLFKPVDSSATRPVPARTMPIIDSDYLADENAIKGDNKTDNTGKSFLQLQGRPDIAGEKPLGGWISSENLYHALTGSMDKWSAEGCVEDLPPFVQPEIRTGLAREKKKSGNSTRPVITGRADEGMLYTLEYLRFAPFTGLVGWFDGPLAEPLSLTALERGTVIAGKKGGLIGFEPACGPDPWWEKIAAGEHIGRQEEKSSKISVWLILLSPGRWESSVALENILHKTTGLEAVVDGCICPPITWLGGFSIARRQPRAVRSWFSAGTSMKVTFSCKEPQPLLALLRDKLNNRCLLEPGEQQPFGYGHILVAPFLDNGEESHG